MAGDAVPPRTSGKAVLSLVLGLAALFFFLLTGLPAVLFGVLGLREINESDGRLAGRRAALAGIALGGLGSIFGLLSLLVIVLLNLQERSNRVHCQGNLMRLGQAVLLHHEREKAFPAGTIPNEGLPPEKRLSWQARLLEYPSLTHEALFQQLNRDRAWDDEANRAAVNTRVRWYLCLSHGVEAGPERAALTHYVGCAGIGPDAAQLPKGDPNSGIFGYDRRVTLKDLTAGASYTFLAAETTTDNGPWAAGGPGTVRGLDPAQRPYAGKGRPFGGSHSDGFNLLRADGSASFVPEGLSPELFELQVRIRREE